MSPSRERYLVLATAFGEGLSVLIVEIAGARALAPYYGTSLKVWTAQITATLLFLALGYGLGGRLSRLKGDWMLGVAFWVGGLWLALYPFLRNSVLSTTAVAGVAGGSFLASTLLFGIPLLCLGAVSPLLIARLEALGRGAGSAAGALFFTNTMGGLAGGWLTALVIIPNMSLRLALAGTGVILALMGSFWVLLLRRSKGVSIVVPLAAFMLMLMAPRPSASLEFGRGVKGTMMLRQESGVGLIQVMDIGVYGRVLLIDGIPQGGMSKETGTSLYEYAEYLNFLSHRYHPQAKSALILGLGGGLLAKQLVARGLRVSAAEVEPAIESVARQWFGLPADATVIPEDARTWINRTDERYDLLFLDAFAGENAPWYLSTTEAMRAMRRVMNPGGRLLINSASGLGRSEGLRRLEANLLEAFGEALVFTEAHDTQKTGLANVTVLAGSGLEPSQEKFPSTVLGRIAPKLEELLKHMRPAQAGGPLMTDDACDLDYAEAELRLEWRRQVFEALGPKILGD